MKRARFEILVIGVVLALSGCQTVQTTQSGVVGVERRQTMLVSSETVNKQATQEYQKILGEARGKGNLNRDPQQVERVRSIANRLIPSTGAFRSDAPGWKWEVNVITSAEVNAWCMPGGKIAVYTGLLDKVKVTDAELAAVMGHEIAHALREHGREQYGQAMAQEIGAIVVGAVLGLGQVGIEASKKFLDVFVSLPHSRGDEVEADRIGVELAARAGYDPHAAISLWQKMNQVGGSRPPEFLSTHPAPENRMKDLQVYAERVAPLYEASRKH
jgi:predicted Zn-dependent protease